jgi:hypothetical protein
VLFPFIHKGVAVAQQLTGYAAAGGAVMCSLREGLGKRLNPDLLN